MRLSRFTVFQRYASAEKGSPLVDLYGIYDEKSGVVFSGPLWVLEDLSVALTAALARLNKT